MKRTHVSCRYILTLLSVLCIRRCVSQTVDITTAVLTTTTLGGSPILTTTTSEISGSGVEETTFTSVSDDQTTFFTTNNEATSMPVEGSSDGSTAISEGTTSITTASIAGSGDSTTSEGSGVTSSGDGLFDTTAELGSAATDVLATTKSFFDVTTFSVINSSTDISTRPTTVFVVTTPIFDFSTENATANATDVTGFVPAATGLEWYFIVIICMGIVILLLIIFFIIFCCLYKKPSQVEKTVSAVGIKTVDNSKLDATPAYVPQAETILPEPKQDRKPVTNLISNTPMVPPVYFQDASASVRKRDKARPRIEPAVSGSDENDEGFNEPLLVKTLQEQQKTARKRPPVPKVPQRVVVEDEFLTERVPKGYQPYYLPTPVQTALTSKALGNTLTDDEMVYRHKLQRSEIERHRNKQRLRRRNSQRFSDPYGEDQKNIDSVLEPPPPAVLQPSSRTRNRLRQKHGNVTKIEGRGAKNRLKDTRLLVEDKQGKYKSLESDADDSETSSQEKIRMHEATISKMAKLLEDAYALLAPVVQRKMMSNVAPTPQHQGQGLPGTAPEYPSQPALTHPYHAQMPPSDTLFTRIGTPPALLPQNDQPPNRPKFDNTTLAPTSDKSNDANSIVWTPYRTFDKIEMLKGQDPSFSIMANSTQSLNPVDPESGTTNPTPQNGNYNDTYMKEGTESTESIVRSIKDALSKMTGTLTPVKEL